MATLIPFHELKTGQIYFEEFKAGTACISCLVVNRIDDTQVNMRYGRACPWNQKTSADNKFRYWDAMPSEDEKKAAKWE